MAWGDNDTVVEDSGKWEAGAPAAPMGPSRERAVGQQMNVPVSALTGDPATDKRLAEIQWEAGNRMDRPAKVSEVAGALAVPAGLALGAVPAATISGGLALGAGSGALTGAGLAALQDKPAGEVLKDAATSAALQSALGLAARGVSALGKHALPRAYRMALKVLRPNADEAMELEKRMVDWETAGKLVDEAGAAKPGMDLRDRRILLENLAKEGGQGMEAARTAAEAKGAVADPTALRTKLEQSVADQFPPGSTLTSTQAEAKQAALRHIEDLSLNPELQGVTGPGTLQAFENAKRSVGVEGFLKGGKYARADVAAKDPEAKFFRRAYKAYKEVPEDAIRAVDKDLADQYVAARAKADVGQTFSPIAQRASNVEFTGTPIGGVPEHMWGEKSGLFRTISSPIMRHARPYLIPVNKGLQSVYNAAPEGTKEAASMALTRAIAEYLRDKENK